MSSVNPVLSDRVVVSHAAIYSTSWPGCLFYSVPVFGSFFTCLWRVCRGLLERRRASTISKNVSGSIRPFVLFFESLAASMHEGEFPVRQELHHVWSSRCVSRMVAEISEGCDW